MTERTPTEFRAIYDAWNVTAPKNDSDIIPDKPRFAEFPRHAGMCADLKSMLAWRDMKNSQDPLQTNFLQAGHDDEIFDDDGSSTFPVRDAECELETRPTVDEMLDSMKDVLWKSRCDHAVIFWRGFTVSTERRVPDIEATPETVIGYGEERTSTVFPGLTYQSIARLGDLRFSDADGYAMYPRGSLLFWKSGRKWKRPSDVAGTPNGLSKSFFPPPEQQRFNQEERLIAMQDATFANDNISPEHAKILDAAIDARNFAEVGETLGFTGKTAERQGKRLVLEAAEDFSGVLRKLAA